MSDDARYSPPSIRFEYISAVGTSLYGTRLQRELPVVTPVLKPNVLDVALVALIFTQSGDRRSSLSVPAIPSILLFRIPRYLITPSRYGRFVALPRSFVSSEIDLAIP